MLYRKDKRTGNDLSILGFGCMRFPMKLGQIDLTATEYLVLTAIERGVNYFDTAYLYNGSEEALGTIVARNNLRDLMFIASKLPHGRCRNEADFDRFLDTTLERLKTDHLDYYLIHNIVSADQWARLVDMGIEGWIEKRRAAGSFKQIGFSFHGSLSEFEKMMDAYDWDFVQIQYNYANERYQAGRGGVDLAAERGIPVIVMEPLLGGRLATGLPKAAREIMHDAEPNRSYAEWSLRWLWDQPDVTVVLSGMNAIEQLDDNAQAAQAAEPGCLGADERVVIERVLDEFGKSYKVPCTGCNYCMPCPQGIGIPSAFAAYNESFSLNWYSGFFHHMVGVGASSKSLHLVGGCIECGACVKKCPQHIDIPAELKNVRKRLEPGPVKPALKAMGAIMTR